MRYEDDERCYHQSSAREPLTISELAIEIACAIYGVTVFIALLCLIGAR